MDEMNHGAGAFVSSGRQVQGGIENPLWVGNISTEESDVALHNAEHSHQVGTQSVSGGALSPADGVTAQFPGTQNSEFQRQPGFETIRSATTKYCQRQEANVDEQTTMMNAYVEKFSPVNPPYPVRPSMGYYAGAGPSTRRLPSVLPEIDLSYRPGSLQEAICMYIDFLMAENEVRTRISECAVASPAPPLDFHREEYYRDVMCRPVNFPTARFREWLKRYNVDIEITDPDGQTVSQTTFAPATPVSECSEAQSAADGGGWSYADGIPTVPHCRRQRPSACSRGAVIYHGDTGQSARPLQLAHASLQQQADSHGVPSDAHPLNCPVNFAPPPAGTAPLASSLYQTQPPPDAVPVASPVDGCGYGLLPEEDDEIKEESPRSGLPVSGWPDVNLEQPESSRAGTTVDCQSFEEDTKDQPLTGSSVDPYIQDGGTAGSDGQFDSRCFATSEAAAAAADEHWTSPVTPGAADNPAIIAVDHDGHDQFTETSPGDAGVSVLDIDNGRAFPMVIEPTSPSESCIPTTNTGTVVQRFAECFPDGRSAGYQLPPYETGSDEQLQRGGAETGTTSQSAGTASCLDLGSDFADLLGTQHSDDFDYHLNYGNVAADQLNHDERHQPLRQQTRRRSTATRSHVRSATTHDAGPARKSLRGESTNH